MHSNEPIAVDGAQIRLGPTDARLTDGETVDLLADLPDFEPQRAEIRELMANLRDDLDLDLRPVSSQLEEAKRRVNSILTGYQWAAGMRPESMLSPGIEAGKVYELWILLRNRSVIGHSAGKRERAVRPVDITQGPPPPRRTAGHRARRGRGDL